MKTAGNKSILISDAFMNLILILLCAACVLPALLVVSVSFMNDPDITKYGFRLFPKHIYLESYSYIFRYPQQILKAYSVSIYITVAGTLLNLLITALVAYPLSRQSFKYRKYISFYIFFTMLFAGGLVPLYLLVVNYLHLKDSLWALILPTVANPLYIFLARIFFQDISASIIEATKIDGASEFRIFSRIVIPLSVPGLITIGLFIALGYWNDYLFALLFIDNQDKVPLQLILYRIQNYVTFIKTSVLDGARGAGLSSKDGQNLSGDAIGSAMAIISTVPMLLVFLYFQKFFVQGLTMGSVKN